MSEKRTHLLYEFRSAGGAVALRPKSDEARHCIDLKSRQLQEYFDLKSRYSGYDLKSHPCPLASILSRGESFLSHVRPKGQQRANQEKAPASLQALKTSVDIRRGDTPASPNTGRRLPVPSSDVHTLFV